MVFSASSRAAAETELKKVLVLHSYHRGLGWTDSIAQGIDQAFHNTDYPVETVTEYMDTKRIFSEEYLDHLARILTFKYRNQKFDVIISSDDHAFGFLLRYHDRIFPDTPVVFCGVNNFKDELIRGRPPFTGVVEAFSIKGTIEAALMINPNLRQVYAVVDKTVTGKANLKLLEAIIPGFKQLEFITITDKDMTDVQKEVSQLPQDSIVLLLAFTSDRSGNVFSLEQSADLITATSNSPVYSFWDFHLNHGIVGGMLTTGLSQGTKAAELSMLILGGQRPIDIPVVKTSPNRYVFDYTVLKKFHIPTNHLPPDSTIINRPPSFYEQYRRLIWPAALIFGLLLVFIMIISNALMKTRAAEARLKISEESYRDIFDNLMDVYFKTTLDGTIENVSPSAKTILGYSAQELIGKKTNMLYQNPEDREEMLTELKKKGQIRGFELIFKKRTGEPFNLSVNADLNFDEYGRPIGLSGTIRDITESKQAQKDKIKAQKLASEHEKLALVGQIAGKMAHDFNNVLGIIMGNAELSILLCKDDQIKHRLELIYKQTIRGKNLTKNLVAFAKDQEPRQRFFRISEKIDLVLNLMKKDLEGIELLKEESPDVPELLADSGMIEHALVNMIQNSIHATSMVEDPRIVIRTFSRGKTICFEIEDNGCGIPEEHLTNIYEPSFTLKGSKDITGSYQPGIKGTGYGMSNVKKYIEQHKGTISIESKWGKGTRFTVSLPVIKKTLTSEEKTKIERQGLNFNKYILLVEDETDIADVQYSILTQAPFSHKVDIADNGQVAMDLFDRNEYDIVSLDYILPGRINGMDVYHHIRETDRNIPILFISGNIEFLESIKELKQKDARIDHLSKPCQNEEYVSSINGLFDNKTGKNHI